MNIEVLDAIGELRGELATFRADVDRRLRSLEAEVKLTRSQFETNGVAVARIERRCAERGRALADLGAEVRGTPLPAEEFLDDVDTDSHEPPFEEGGRR